MRKTLLSLILVFALVAPLNATAAIKSGASCKKAGQTSTYAGKKYTCIKSGKTLVWNKGVVIVKPTHVSTPTPSPSLKASNTPVPTQTPSPEIPPTINPIIEKAPTGFNDLIEHYLGIPGAVWTEAQKLERLGSTKSSFAIEIGPNTKIQDGLENPKVFLERASRLWSRFDQSSSTKVFVYSFPDLSWAQQKNRELVGSWFTPDDLANNCTSLLNCGAFGGSYKGVAQLFIGVPVKPYQLFNLGFVRGTYGHEYTHSVQYAQFASQTQINGYSILPCWFSEGQPQVPGQTLGFRTLNDYKISRESWFNQPAGSLIDYSPESILRFYKLAGVPKDAKCEASIRSRVYDVGYMTVEALASVKGIESTMQVVLEVSKGFSFNQSFEKVYGISWDEAALILAKVVSKEFSRP